MNAQWRLLVTALRFDMRLAAAALSGADIADPGAAARYFPIAGVLVGAVGGAAYWLGTLLWPTSIAVILSMLATTAMSGGVHAITRSTPATLAVTTLMCALATIG